MQYKYTASRPDGGIEENRVEAGNVSEVLQFLSSRGLKPITVDPVGKSDSADRSLFKGRIDMTDQIFIFRYLALMLRIGTNLLQAVNILIEDLTKPAVRSFLLEVRSNLERGAPFYSTFQKYQKIFTAVQINLIKAGEVSGNLESVFENLTTTLTKEKTLRDQIRNALIYPALLLGISAFILIFLVTFALPRIANVFLDSGFEPPAFSKFVFTVGLAIGNIWYWILIVLVLAIIILVYLYKKSLFFKKFVWAVLTDLPVIKDIIQKRALQRFASTTSSLIKAGIPINQALEITADATGHVKMQQALMRISREGIAKGLSLGEAFRREPLFPNTVVNLVAIAEKAGHIENVLETLGEFYVEEIDSAIKRLVSLVEPLLLLIIGVVIGVIALAIIVPIYQLTTQF